MMQPHPAITLPVIVLVGPTAVGKTALSLDIAHHFDCEIVSLDSMQVYRHMDIGTAKASFEERSRVAHHLIDIIDPDAPYDASRYVKDALEAIRTIHGRNKIPLLTGGTGLYLRALTEGLFEKGAGFSDLRAELHRRLSREGAGKLHEELSRIDPESARKIHVNDTHRLIRGLEIYYGTNKRWSDHLAEQRRQRRDKRFTAIFSIGLQSPRQTLYARIDHRTRAMMRQGLKEEVSRLLVMGYGRHLKSMQAIGYRHMVEHLLDGRPLEEIEELLARDTRRYAKRQYTWFKNMELTWFDVAASDAIIEAIAEFLG